MALHLEAMRWRNIVVLRCKGRLVSRAEAAALAGKVGELLQRRRPLVLDISHLDHVDSTGLGGLVMLHMWAKSRGLEIKFASPTERIRHLLETTNLASFLPLYITVDDAVMAAELAHSA
jgi:anti-sigma B factor antagonist